MISHPFPRNELLPKSPSQSHYRDDDVSIGPFRYKFMLDQLVSTWIQLIPGQSCSKCNHSWEVYTIDTEWGPYCCNIPTAMQIVRDGRKLAWIAPLPLIMIVADSEITADHLNHIATPEEPGILAYFAAPDGSTRVQLIDGNHRAARALVERRFFSVYVLEPEETARCRI